jgi:cobalamin biosynthesis Mg chelatase CobN
MWGFSHHGRWLAGTLLGGCLALVLTAAPASAEISSVDAYGGQAQVLGKPVHRSHHHRAAGRSPETRGSRVKDGHGAGASGAQTGDGGSSASSSSSVSPATSTSTAGSSSQASTAPSGSHASPTPGSADPSSGPGGGSSAGGHRGAAGAAASEASGAGQSPPIASANVADVSDGSLSLSALDVLLLVVVCAGLAGIGVLIRRWSRQAE